MHVSALLVWAADCERQSTAREARIIDGRERWQPLGASVLRVSVRVGLVWSLFSLLFERPTATVLIPLLVLWVALVVPERP